MSKNYKKRLNKEQEKKLLDDCLKKKNCEELVKQYLILVQKFIKKTFKKYNYYYSELEVEDLSQDVFLKLFSGALEKFDFNKNLSLSGWIIMIAVRTTINYIILIRNRDGKVSIDIDVDPEIAPVIDRTDTIERYKLLISIKKTALKVLSKREKEVFNLHCFECMDYKEIAYYLGISENASSTCLSRAKEKLWQYKDLFL